jgi:6-phosphogluconolactonase (cycloisomerase 2 family)
MQSKLALLVALAACRIPDEQFTHITTGDGGAIDTAPGGKDAAVNPDALTRGYLFGFNAGIYRVNKDPATGALTLADPNPTVAGGAPSGASNKEGTHLYAVLGASSQLIDYSIAADGALTQQALATTGSCAPISAKLHPGGKFLAVGCSNAQIAIIPIGANGSLGTPKITLAGETPANPVFSPNGTCLYFPDLTGPPASRILAFQFNAATGTVTPSGAATGPNVPRGLAVHPGGGFAYMAGSGTIQSYALDATCGLTPLATVSPGGTTTQVTIDPPGNRLFVTGSAVFVFTIANNGLLTAAPGSPFLSTGTTMDAAIMDPAVPDLLYITGRGYSGTIVTQLGANGVLTQLSSLTINGGDFTWLQLVH